MPLNEIRSCEFWIVGGSSAVRSHISIFVSCQRYRGGVPVQKMANPPPERPVTACPFTHCAIGCFGPWIIKEGREEMKRYRVIFTCMASRVTHLETAKSLETVIALRRFFARRGPTR